MHFGQHLLFQKFGEKWRCAVKLVATVVAHHIAHGIVHHAWLQKHADGHRHLALRNQRVDYGRGVAKHTVEPHIQARWFLAIVFFGHIHLQRMSGARINLRICERVANQLILTGKHRSHLRKHQHQNCKSFHHISLLSKKSVILVCEVVGVDAAGTFHQTWAWTLAVVFGGAFAGAWWLNLAGAHT